MAESIQGQKPNKLFFRKSAHFSRTDGRLIAFARYEFVPKTNSQL